MLRRSWLFSVLPRAGADGPELSHGGHMGIESAVYRDDLAADIGALIGAEVDTGVADILGAAIAVDHDIAQEDVLQGLGNTGLVVRGDDQARADAVAADVVAFPAGGSSLCV